jgi:hypothetical protein
LMACKQRAFCHRSLSREVGHVDWASRLGIKRLRFGQP